MMPALEGRMRIVVLGHSTSSGEWLADRAQAWPWLVAAELEARTGAPVEVVHHSFVPMGGRAVPYGLVKTAEAEPDVVLVPVATFVCCVGTVGERIRRRWGERAFRAYHRLERAFDLRTGNRPGARGRFNRLGRRVSRRLLGTATFTSVDDVVEVYRELLRGLAQREGLVVGALMEPSWPAWMDAENPGAKAMHARIREEVGAFARQQHVLWADSDDVYMKAADRGALYFADGVHKTVAGHRAYADALLPVLLALDGPLAEEIHAATP
jgi:lysophospholipase L1-like esterase